MRVSEDTPNAIKRVNKIGNTVHELFYDSFTGSLVSIDIKDGDYGRTWNFGFKDSGEVYTLQLSYSNSFSTAFLKMLPNIDLSKDMVVSPSVKEVEGKSKSSLFVNQGGTAIKHAYTMADPNGMPDMEQVTIKGEKVWDDTKRLEFLSAMVAKDIVPQLGAVVAEENAVVAEGGLTEAKPTVSFPSQEEDINPDDIPF